MADDHAGRITRRRFIRGLGRGASFLALGGVTALAGLRARREDYVWQIPEFSVQVTGYLVSAFRAGAKYRNNPIHMYVMPHSPGNTPRSSSSNVGCRLRYLPTISPWRSNTTAVL